MSPYSGYQTYGGSFQSVMTIDYNEIETHVKCSGGTLPPVLPLLAESKLRARGAFVPDLPPGRT